MAQMKNVSELNKLTVRLFIEAVLSEGHLELIDELIAADYAGHLCAEPKVTGPAGVRQLVSSHRHAHPGLHVKIEDQIAEDDRVATRWHATVPAPKAQPPRPRPRRAHCILRRKSRSPVPGRKTSPFPHRMHPTSPQTRARRERPQNGTFHNWESMRGHPATLS